MTAIAYLAGVIRGDGWCTRLTIGLRVADHSFAEAFSAAIKEAFDTSAPAKLDERGYWLVRTSNKKGRFNSLLAYTPKTDRERAAWLRGMFDSEGNASLRLNGISENSYGRRVAFYSTNEQTLLHVRAMLGRLGIPSRIAEVKPSKGHKGTLPVFEVSVRGGRDHYANFAKLVGSTIPRKQQVLNAIAPSYRPDVAAHCRAAQAKGVANRRARKEAAR